MIAITAVFGKVVETAAITMSLDIGQILVHFRPPDDGEERMGRIVAQFGRDFVMRTPIELANDCVMFLRINSRNVLGGQCVETQAFGRVVCPQKLADGKSGYLIHIL